MKTNPCKFLKRFVSLSLLGFALLALPVLPVSAEDAPQMPDHGLCAHRGDVANFPENTVIAFQAAAEKGAEMVEFDICRTKDGKFIVMHDFTVDRTTNGHGKIADLTFDEIRKLDAGSKKAPQFAGTQVPTPEEVLDCLPRNIWINVHLKGDVPGDVIARMIKEKGRLHQAFLAANQKQIEAARQAVPEIIREDEVVSEVFQLFERGDAFQRKAQVGAGVKGDPAPFGKAELRFGGSPLQVNAVR